MKCPVGNHGRRLVRAGQVLLHPLASGCLLSPELGWSQQSGSGERERTSLPLLQDSQLGSGHRTEGTEEGKDHGHSDERQGHTGEGSVQLRLGIWKFRGREYGLERICGNPILVRTQGLPGWSLTHATISP